MDKILAQLGGLLLGAIPTVVSLLVIYAAYKLILHKPLEHTLAERHARTEGAIEKARADVAAAEAKTAEYENALREARLEVFRAQEQRRKRAVELRTEAVAAARAEADARVKEAKAAIAADVAVARTTLGGEAERLASEVIGAVLKGANVAPSVGGAR